MREPDLSSRLALRNRTFLPFCIHQQAPLAIASLIRCLGKSDAWASASTAVWVESTVISSCVRIGFLTGMNHWGNKSVRQWYEVGRLGTSHFECWGRGRGGPPAEFPGPR